MWFVKQHGCHSNTRPKLMGKSFKYSGPLRFVPWFFLLWMFYDFLKQKKWNTNLTQFYILASSARPVRTLHVRFNQFNMLQLWPTILLKKKKRLTNCFGRMKNMETYSIEFYRTTFLVPCKLKSLLNFSIEHKFLFIYFDGP